MTKDETATEKLTKRSGERTTKPRKKPVAKYQDTAFFDYREPGETTEQAAARMFLRPTVGAGVTVASYKCVNFIDAKAEFDIPHLVNELTTQCNAVMRGDLGRAECMLIAQAHSLDAIFTSLARRASLNMGEYVDAAERYLRLALRAQSQCRATLETLAAVKNPPVVIARQANVTSGPQQVNNGVPLARENSIEPNKLLEQSNGKWLDGGAASETSGGD